MIRVEGDFSCWGWSGCCVKQLSGPGHSVMDKIDGVVL